MLKQVQHDAIKKQAPVSLPTLLGVCPIRIAGRGLSFLASQRPPLFIIHEGFEVPPERWAEDAEEENRQNDAKETQDDAEENDQNDDDDEDDFPALSYVPS